MVVVPSDRKAQNNYTASSKPDRLSSALKLNDRVNHYKIGIH